MTYTIITLKNNPTNKKKMKTSNNYELLRQGADLYKALNDLYITRLDFIKGMKLLFGKSSYADFSDFDYACYNLSFTRNY